jgi:hypothetical protein
MDAIAPAAVVRGAAAAGIALIGRVGANQQVW